MLVINRLLIGTNNDDEHHKALVDRQCKITKRKILSKIEDKGDHNHHDHIKYASPKQER